MSYGRSMNYRHLEVFYAVMTSGTVTEAARRLGVSPAACAVVEDSAKGVAAARAAGMAVFAYAGGVTPAERLAGDGTTVFARMDDLPALLGRAR